MSRAQDPVEGALACLDELDRQGVAGVADHVAELRTRIEVYQRSRREAREQILRGIEDELDALADSSPRTNALTRLQSHVAALREDES
ncbi:MAG: hypothetical protein ABEJ68_03315 [Halobacteriaceae archaeon]